MLYKPKSNTKTNRAPIINRSSVDLDGIRDFTITVDISLLLKNSDSNESPTSSPPDRNQTRSTSVQSSIAQPELPAYVTAISGNGGKRSMGAHPSESPAKKQSKWSPEEDALIIDLRGSGMKWEDISKRLPGRSAISCPYYRITYLERRSEWDEERKNKLARLYERFKQEMWSKSSRRNGSTMASSGSHALATRRKRHGKTCWPGTAQGNPNSRGATRTIAARRESTPRSVPPTSPTDGLALAAIGGGMGMIGGRGGQYLPSLVEMTTGVSPYTTPAYAMSMPTHSSGYSSGILVLPGPYPSPGPLLPAIGMINRLETKRRGSPETGSRESTRRRQ
ncbi:hypothetical protein DID88_009582 [Monilinia fructigena]|uniref:Myb-like domain-containing protein n=1 Tax=Monilinia fructigena TaxID=38457 RepID=A0A395IQ66_9HELO|nr:hypothetical protein DID88_009582 [Monilinia fructigena]